LDFSKRLKNRFHALNREIDRIIEAFHLEVYAERILDEQQLVAAKSAWYSLHSPFLWPSRLKTRYFPSAG